MMTNRAKYRNPLSVLMLQREHSSSKMALVSLLVSSLNVTTKVKAVSDVVQVAF